jgi:hypothetical protein
MQKLVEAGVVPADGFTAVVAERFRNQCTVFVEIFYPFGKHGDRLILNVMLERCPDNTRRQGNIWWGRIIYDGLIFARHGRNGGIAVVIRREDVARWRDGIVFPRFVNLHWFAVEVRVSKVVGGLAEINEGKVIL